MARERMVTRTITNVDYEVMTVFNKEVTSSTVSLPKADLTTEKEEKRIKSNLPEGHLFVQVVSKKETETLYGMTELEFLKYAKILPPRTKQEQQEQQEQQEEPKKTRRGRTKKQ